MQSRADRKMQKTFSNIELYAPDNFHSWGAPPPTQPDNFHSWGAPTPTLKNGLCIGQQACAVKYRSEVVESIQC